MKTNYFWFKIFFFLITINSSAQNLTIIFLEGNEPKVLFARNVQPDSDELIDTITVKRVNANSILQVNLIHRHLTDNDSETIALTFASGINQLQIPLDQGRFTATSKSNGVVCPSSGTFVFPIEINYGSGKKINFGITKSPSVPTTFSPKIADEKRLTQFNFLFEEDFLLGMFGLGGLNYDRDYTGGFSFVFHGSLARNAFIISPTHRFLDRICFQKQLSDKYDFSKYSANIKFGGSAFSPYGNKLKETSPVIGDRPYASLMYVGQSFTYLSMNNKNAITSDFVFGMLGLSIMGDVQTGIHRLYKKNAWPFAKEPDPQNIIRPYYPQGWHNQISCGGEPTLLYALTARQLLKRLSPSSQKADSTVSKFDLVQMESVNIGYYNNLRYGLTLRFGKIKSHWSSFSSSPISNIQAQGRDTTKNNIEAKPVKRFPQYYFFAGARANIVVYNALMEGQFKHSVYTLDETEIKHVIFEGEIGLYIQPWKKSGFTFTLAGRTADFKTTTIQKSHLWASLYYTLYLD